MVYYLKTSHLSRSQRLKTYLISPEIITRRADTSCAWLNSTSYMKSYHFMKIPSHYKPTAFRVRRWQEKTKSLNARSGCAWKLNKEFSISSPNAVPNLAMMPAWMPPRSVWVRLLNWTPQMPVSWKSSLQLKPVRNKNASKWCKRMPFSHEPVPVSLSIIRRKTSFRKDASATRSRNMKGI